MLRWKLIQQQKEEEKQQLEREPDDLEYNPHHAFHVWLARMDLADPLKPRTQPVDCATQPASFELYSDNEEADMDLDALDDPTRVSALNIFLKENEKQFENVQESHDHIIKVEADVAVCNDDDDVFTCRGAGRSTTCCGIRRTSEREGIG